MTMRIYLPMGHNIRQRPWRRPHRRWSFLANPRWSHHRGRSEVWPAEGQLTPTFPYVHLRGPV